MSVTAPRYFATATVNSRVQLDHDHTRAAELRRLPRARPPACFVCELLSGNPGYPHHVAYRDEVAIEFASRFPSVVGHFLVAPVDHREYAIDDFTPDEYAAIQRIVHRAGTALSSLLPIERLYVLSLGSQQANRHVHWHLAPLPPGVPYEDQQIAVFEASRGVLDLPDDEVADLARRLGERMAN